MVRQLLQQLQGVLSTKDSVETAKVCRAIVEEGVRTVCQRLGKEANPTTGLLEMLSRPEVSGFVDDAEVSQALEFVRFLGANATHGRRIKKTQAEFAATATSDDPDAHRRRGGIRGGCGVPGLIGTTRPFRAAVPRWRILHCYDTSREGICDNVLIRREWALRKKGIGR